MHFAPSARSRWETSLHLQALAQNSHNRKLGIGVEPVLVMLQMLSVSLSGWPRFLGQSIGARRMWKPADVHALILILPGPFWWDSLGFFRVLWMSINRRLQMFLFYFFYTSWNKIVVSDGSSFTVPNKSGHILSEKNLLDLSPVLFLFSSTLCEKNVLRKHLF